MQRRSTLLALPVLLLAVQAFAQQTPPQQLFRKNCASCHGDDARGSAQGPGLAFNRRVAEQSNADLRAFLERGNAAAGMPAFADLPAADLATLAEYLRRLNVDTILGPPPASDTARKVRVVPPQPGDWLTYNGNDSGKQGAGDVLISIETPVA